MGKSTGGDQVFRITGARASLTDDIRGRERRYIISMSIRTVCVVLSVVLWNVERYLAIVALVGGALLPYIAVVVANAGREKSPSLPGTFVADPSLTMIGPGQAEQHAPEDEPITLVGETIQPGESAARDADGARTSGPQAGEQ